jgi:prepilin-type N-terminal cleavage/methylation domain-containing protein
MKNFYTRKQGGYTLVETLVAISIFAVSILGILVALSQGLVDNGYAKKKVVAAYLAQEGIEYVRNLRDTYMIYGGNPQTSWDTFKSRLTQAPASCDGASGCYFNPSGINYSDQSQPIIDMSITGCSGSCPVLLYSNGAYSYSAGIDSGYRRKISVVQENADEIKVISTVSWTQGSGTYSVVFSDSLFNWIE